MIEKTEENIIFIGGKPFMNYITGIVLQFTTNKAEEVKVVARGKFISKAVDIVEITQKKFLKELNISVKEIKIDSEEFDSKEGKKITVSTIEIILKKN